MTDDVEMVGVVVPREEWDELRAQVAEIHEALAVVFGAAEEAELPSPNDPWPGFSRYRAARKDSNG